MVSTMGVPSVDFGSPKTQALVGSGNSSRPLRALMNLRKDWNDPDVYPVLLLDHSQPKPTTSISKH